MRRKKYGLKIAVEHPNYEFGSNNKIFEFSKAARHMKKEHSREGRLIDVH